MAFANYEGQAFRNGEHWHEGCDAILPAGEGKYSHMPHAVVGDGSVRVGVQKTAPMLYCQQADGTWTSEVLRGVVTVRDTAERDLIAIGINPLGGPGVAVLAEPDGTVWVALSAYEPFDDWCEKGRPQ